MTLVDFILFADDSNVFISHKTYEGLFQLVNQELKKITEWFKSNKLSLNLNKTNYILFCSHRKKIPSCQGIIRVDNFQIPQAISVKFLGVHLDQHLTWNNHIAQIASKISKNTGILSHVAHILPTHVRLNLYYSLIHPFLSYCNMVWASNYVPRLKRLILLQRKAVRIIAGPCFQLSTAQKFHNFKIPNLEQIKTIQICEFMFKYRSLALPNIFDGYFHSTSEFHHYEVRSASNYRGIPIRTKSRKFSLKYTGPITWNSLPLQLRNAHSFHLFKKQLHSYLVSQVT